MATAIATRDYQDVHHDRDKAQAKGSKDIFVNILTDTGLVQRYITDWAGPTAVIKSIGLRLGVPWYAYDTVTFRGEVTAIDDGLITLKITGSNSLGDHVIATATLTIGGVTDARRVVRQGGDRRDQRHRLLQNSGRSELRLASELCWMRSTTPG